MDTLIISTLLRDTCGKADQANWSYHQTMTFDKLSWLNGMTSPQWDTQAEMKQQDESPAYTIGQGQDTGLQIM